MSGCVFVSPLPGVVSELHGVKDKEKKKKSERRLILVRPSRGRPKGIET